MNQESRHFCVHAPMSRPRLASRGFDPDDHIAEKLPTLVAVLPFDQRKRQDIRRGTLSPVLEIQRRNFVVRHDRDGKFRFRLIDRLECADGLGSEQAGVDPG